jgi:hypothetical protein
MSHRQRGALQPLPVCPLVLLQDASSQRLFAGESVAPGVLHTIDALQRLGFEGLLPLGRLHAGSQPARRIAVRGGGFGCGSGPTDFISGRVGTRSGGCRSDGP